MEEVFLRNPTRDVDEVDQSLQLSKPADAYKASKQKLINALGAAKLECTLNLRPTSDATQFENLQDLVTRVRNVSCKIIKESGNPEQPLELLIKASELLNILDIHIFVLNHVKLLQGRSAPIAEDVNALGVSIKMILTHIDSFRTEVKKCLLD